MYLLFTNIIIYTYLLLFPPETRARILRTSSLGGLPLLKDYFAPMLYKGSNYVGIVIKRLSLAGSRPLFEVYGFLIYK